ncbi:PDCD5-related protein [Lyophyllum atratum]|nr:PDCD5-related protein [Lyophyllum atratum]
MEGLGHIQDAVPSQGSPQVTGDEEAKRAQEEQTRRDLMSKVLDPAARERLSRIALVSPDRSKQIEGILLRMAQSGQLRGRVTENQLIELLEQMEEVQGTKRVKGSTIVYQRRKDLDDDFDF